MMVTLDANEFRLEEDRYEIGAFVNGECRGSARLQHIASIGQHIAFLTVTGEEGEEVAFHLFDAASDETRILIADEHIAYHADAVHGTLKAPMPLHFSNNGVHGYHEVGLYPNPTTGKVTVKASGMRGITVTDVFGQVVYETLMNDAELTLDLSKYEPGLYLVHVDLDNGSVVRKVVMTK